MLVASGLLFSVGCQNRAHSDLYQQRMANEIRVLEDQLYEADYENRKLRDELERAKGRVEVDLSTPRRSSDKPSASYGPAVPTPVPLSDGPMYPHAESYDSFDMEHGFDDTLIDPGQAVPMDRLDNPFTDDPNRSGPKPGTPKQNTPDSGKPKQVMPLPPPIGVPEPPGKSDTEIAPIEPGEVLPPPSPNGKGESQPPGQIILPDAVKATQPKISAPEKLELHAGLSGGHQTDNDDAVDGLYLVINALDHRGATVDLEKFEIDAELTVVVLDPAREPSEAKIGRWEFSSEEVSQLIRSRPVSGFHVPVNWQDVQPEGEEVIVHVRLRSDDDEMRCEGRVQVAESGVIAKWTPRGDAPRQR